VIHLRPPFPAAETLEIVANRLVAAAPAALEKVGHHSPGLVSVQSSLYEPAQILGTGMFFHTTPCLKAKSLNVLHLAKRRVLKNCYRLYYAGSPERSVEACFLLRGGVLGAPACSCCIAV
jgi:hypothetical protein